MKYALTLIILTSLVSCTTSKKKKKQHIADEILPSYFDNGDRIFLKIPTVNKDTINVFTDTGGGFTAIYPDALKRINLVERIRETTIYGEKENIIYAEDIVKGIKYYPFLTQAMKNNSRTPFFFVPTAEFVLQNNDESIDGFFGQYFFMNKTWTFDYPNEKVILHHNSLLTEANTSAEKVGFKKDEQGNKLFGHPSFQIQVEGEKIPVLFDTGATFTLSQDAAPIFGNKKHIGGSFIAKSVFDIWRTANPDWQIIKKGDIITENGKAYGFDMIQVPKLTLGTFEVGPVWFSVRADAAWSKGMITSMDKVVKGAVGGSAFKYLSVSIDYKNELLIFEN